MPANPLYYAKLHSAQVMKQCPTMTSERYMEGYERTNTLVNAMIGVANEVARLAISDAIDAVKKAGLYRQRTKQLCRETFRRQEEYEEMHCRNFGDLLKMWLDYLDGAEEEYRRHIFNIYMAVKMILDRHRQKDAELKARLECARICAELAVGQFDALMKDMQEEYGVDYAPLFSAGRYDRPLHAWRKLCDLYVKTDDPDDCIDMNGDANLRLAAEVLARKLSDSEVLNRIGTHTISMNMETARRYVSDENLRELGVEKEDTGTE